MRFQSPENLYFLFAIAIPILIHLLNLSKYKSVYFSSIRFLKDVTQEHHNKIKIKNILILISRILAITFLIFAFSKPYVHEKNVIKTENIFIYIDNSLSTDIDYGEGNLLNKAKNKAKEIIKLYSNQTSFYLITNDFFSKHNKIFNNKYIADQIDKIESTSKQRSINDIISRANSLNSNYEMYFISDMQKNTVKLKEISNIEIVNKTSIVYLENRAIKNITIDSCYISKPVFVSEKKINLKVIISNNGPDDIVDEVVFLYLNNKQKSQQYISLKSRDKIEINFPFKILNNDFINGEIRVNDSYVSFDNSLFFSLNKSNKIKVCIINNKNHKSFESLFKIDTTLFDYSQFNKSNINYNELLNQKFIILNEIQELSSGLISTLNKFISNGNSLMIIPPAKINDIKTYNNILKEFKINTIDSKVKIKQNINKFDFENPIYRNVFATKNKKITYPKSNQNYRLNKNKIFTNIISFENNNSFLNSYSINTGTIYQLASPIDTAFNNFAQHALFVPTLINIATSSIQINAPYYLINNSSKVIYNKDLPKKTIKIKGPKTDIIPTITNNNGKFIINTHNQIINDGVYSLEHDNIIFENIALNYNRIESNLKSYTLSDLKNLSKNKINLKILPIKNKALISEIKEQLNGKEFWKIAIIFSLIFFLFEIILIKLIKL